MRSAAVLAVVPEGLAVRTVVIVPLLVGVRVAVVELATADVTIGDQGVTSTTALSEGDRHRPPVSRGAVDWRRPAVVTPVSPLPKLGLVCGLTIITPLGVGQRIVILCEVKRLNPNGFG